MKNQRLFHQYYYVYLKLSEGYVGHVHFPLYFCVHPKPYNKLIFLFAMHGMEIPTIDYNILYYTIIYNILYN